jgi:hypothetical protein
MWGNPLVFRLRLRLVHVKGTRHASAGETHSSFPFENYVGQIFVTS